VASLVLEVGENQQLRYRALVSREPYTYAACSLQRHIQVLSQVEREGIQLASHEHRQMSVRQRVRFAREMRQTYVTLAGRLLTQEIDSRTTTTTGRGIVTKR
jgi:hypothetical protein